MIASGLVRDQAIAREDYAAAVFAAPTSAARLCKR